MQPSNNSLLWSILTFVGCSGLFWFMTGSPVFAVAFMALLAIHEMGHYVAAKHIGLDVTLPTFTPIGAFIEMKSWPRNAAQEAYMALGGPLLGSIAAFVALVASVKLGMPELGLAAKFGFWLNLFNLIPWSPLDGGRISQVLSRHLWVVGILLLGLFALTFDLSFMTIIVLVLIVSSGYKDVQFRSALAQEQPEYYQVDPGVRVAYGAVYVALAAALFYGLTQFGALLKFLIQF